MSRRHKWGQTAGSSLSIAAPPDCCSNGGADRSDGGKEGSDGEW